MSLLCIGSNFDGKEMSEQFHESGEIWLNEKQLEEGMILPMSKILDEADVGTCVVIKSFHPINGLSVKGIGIIYSQENWSGSGLKNTEELARRVKWLWKGNHCFGKFNDSMDHMRTGPMYYELNENVSETIFSLIEE